MLEICVFVAVLPSVVGVSDVLDVVSDTLDGVSDILDGVLAGSGIFVATVLFISESPRPYLCSKLALFNTSLQILKVLLCCISSIVSIEMAYSFQMSYFSLS